MLDLVVGMAVDTLQMVADMAIDIHLLAAIRRLEDIHHLATSRRRCFGTDCCIDQ